MDVKHGRKSGWQFFGESIKLRRNEELIPECDLQCAKHLENVIRFKGAVKRVAAFISEPLVGANGIIVPAELLAADTGLGYLITMGRRLAMPRMVVLGMILVGLTGAVIGIRGANNPEIKFLELRHQITEASDLTL